MKNKIKGFFRFFKRPRNIILAVVVLAVAAFFVFGGKKQQTADLITVKSGTITQDVVVTGDITSSENVDLSFQGAGTVAKVNVATGDKVNTGDILLTEDSSVLQAELQQAEASVAQAEANLGVLQNGATPQDIAVSFAEVSNAESALLGAEKNVVSTVQDAYTKADDAVYNQADQIFTNPRTNPQLVFSIPNQQLAVDIQSERLSIESDFSAWNSSLSGLTATSDLPAILKETKGYLGDIQNFLADVASALNLVSPSGSVSASSLDTWKTDVASGRAEVVAAVGDVVTSESALDSDQTALAVAEKQLALKQAPATPDQIAADEAAVSQAKAQVSLIQAQIDQTILRSPVAGTVTNVVPKKGEVATAGETVISIIGNNSLEVEAYVAESDVAKLKVGDPVSITLDALPGETFTGHLLSIDPAETIVNGVANYKVKISFDAVDPRFKSGLTANLTIETQRKDNVLIVPQFAIIQNDQGTFAVKMVNGKQEQVPITLGIQDQNGNAEVVSGLSEGDQVLNVGLNPQS